MRGLALAFIAGTSLLLLSGPAMSQGVRPPEDSIRIREFDKVFLREGRMIEGRILNQGELEGQDIKISKPTRTGKSIEITFPWAEIESIVRRQSADRAYANYETWLREKVRGKGRRERRRRARAELEIGRWCYYPRPEIGGRAPRLAAATGHFENAVRLDSSLEDAYGYLLVLYERNRQLDDPPVDPPVDLPVDALNREVATYMLAERSGLANPVMRFRLGALLAGRLGLLGRAVPYLESVLADPDANPGIRRQSRGLLAEAYFRRGEPRKALAIYERIVVEDEGRPENFEALHAMAMLHLRIASEESLEAARDLLLRAGTIQPHYLEILRDLAGIDHRQGKLVSAAKYLDSYIARRSDDVGARVDRALVSIRQGQFTAAGKSLEKLTEKTPRAELALGLIREMRGDEQGAMLRYRSALALDPENVVTRLLIIASLVRQGLPDDARREAEALQSARVEDREVFGACSRLLAASESSAGRDRQACAHLEHAVSVDPRDPALLELASLTFLRAGDPRRGTSFLNEVLRLAPGRRAALNGLGFIRYREGEFEAAEKAFRSVKKTADDEAARKPGADTPDDQAAYTASALSKIRDLRDLEVWVDEFEGGDGPVIDGWKKLDRYGIEIRRQDNQVIFEGTQAHFDDGQTVLLRVRKIDAGPFEKLTARIRLDSGKPVPTLQLETPKGSNRIGALRIYRDLDGLVKFQRRTSRGDWETPEVAEEKPTSAPRTGSRRRARLVYRGGVPWQDDGEFHTLEIRRVAVRGSRTSRTPTRRFDLYLDDKMVARNVVVAGLGGAEYEAAIQGSTDTIDSSYSFTVENFKIYQRVSGGEPRSSRSGGVR